MRIVSYGARIVLRCEVCGKEVVLPYECSYCGKCFSLKAATK